MDLINELKRHDELYYNGESEISDYDYDKLKDKAKLLFPNDPYFTQVGAKIKIGKVKLPYVLGSLKKIKPDTLDIFFKFRAKNEYNASEKLDGISIYVEIENKNVIFAALRGDGEYGKDVTDKIKKVFKYQKYKILNDDLIKLRGECILTRDSHIKLGKKNRRNTVSGIMNSDSDIGLEYVECIFYELIYPEIKHIPTSFNYIKNSGLKICWNINVGKLEVNKLIKVLFDAKNNAIENEYDIDGLVLCPIEYERENVSYSSEKVAFKVNDKAIKTKVIGIRWQVGRTGIITPVVNIDPVEIGGVTISNVTAFNKEYIKNNNIRIGSEVGVLRSGDVIPYLTEVFSTPNYDKFEYDGLNNCPSCGNTLTVKGVHFICENPGCNPYRKLEYFLRTLGAQNISEKTLRNLKLDSLKKIYEVDEFDISMFEGFGLTRGEQIVSEIYKTLLTTESDLLMSFGIPGIGKENSKLLVNHLIYDNFNQIFESNRYSYIDLVKIPGIGKTVAKTFISDINKYKSVYEYLLSKGLKFKQNKININIKDKVFAITGNFRIKRPMLIKLIEEQGGQVKGVGKNTNILVAADVNSGSGKIKNAMKFGTKIISYEELLRMLGVDL